MDVATGTQKRINLRTNLRQKYGFLMIRIQNMGVKAIHMCLIPILEGAMIYNGIIYSKTPLKGLAPIYEVKEVLLHIRFNIAHRYMYHECA